MSRHRQALVGLWCLLLCMGATYRAQAQDGIPYFALSGVAPDVLVLLDASLSMRFFVPYDNPTCKSLQTTYPLKKPGEICDLYTNDDCVCRDQVAGAVIADLVADNPKVRWGLMRTSNSTTTVCKPGTPLVKIGTVAQGDATTNAFVKYLVTASTKIKYDNQKDLEGGIATSAVEWDRAIKADANKSCRKKAMIIVTGGGYDARGCLLYPNAVPALSTLYASPAGSGGAGSIPTYVVGFNLTMDGSYATLDDMAEAGQGKTNPTSSDYADAYPFDAKDATEFRAELTKVFNEIMYGSYTNSDPVLGPGYTDLYQAYFDIVADSYGWQGHVKDYALTSSGAVSLTRWDAGTKLQSTAWSSRSVYTAIYNGSDYVRQAFNTSSAGVLLPYLALSGVSPDCNATKGETTDADALIRFILGDVNARYASCTDYKENWKLYDIFNSSPKLVTPPQAPWLDADYANFIDMHENRPDLLIAGGNGGMLHAFRAADNLAGVRTPSTGAELWGYVPAHLLPKLQQLWGMQPHPTFVDGSPAVKDLKVQVLGEVAPAWHTISVFGDGLEGSEDYCNSLADVTAGTIDYYCGVYNGVDVGKLDGTGYNIDPLFEFTGDGDIITAAARPTFAKVRVSISSQLLAQPLVFLAGVGRFTAPPKNTTLPYLGAPIYAVHPGNGKQIGKILLPWRDTSDPEAAHGVRGAPVAVDTNDDLLADRLYVGDVEGRMWRIDISSSSPGDWAQSSKSQVIFDPGSTYARLPITYPVSAVYTEAGDVLVYFGSGDPEHAVNGGPSGHFYVMVDKRSITSTSATMWENGEFPLQFDPGEVLAGEPTVANGILYFTTYVASSTECHIGTARLYMVNYLTGDPEYDANSDGIPESQYVELGEGLPSSPVLGDGKVYVSMSDGSPPKDQPKSTKNVSLLKPLSWVEIAGH